MTLKRSNSIFAVVICLLLVVVSTGSVFAQGDTGATGGIFGEYEVQPGATVEVPVEIRDVANLYAVDVEIRFDPAVVQVQDANPDAEGVQPALGMFLDAGLTLFNTVDNEAGIVRFVMTQVNPSEAKSGSGIVLVLYIQGVSEGVSDLEVSTFDLSTRGGEAIPVEPVSGTITVSGDAAEAVSAAIPVQDQGQMVAIPTVMPTAEPTESADDETAQAQSPTDAQANQVMDDEKGEAPEETNTAAGEAAAETSGFSLVKYWWVVLIVVVLVAGFGVYLWATRK